MYFTIEISWLIYTYSRQLQELEAIFLREQWCRHKVEVGMRLIEKRLLELPD